ncbi:TIGR03621 family F420-dependent LLM class oxidoreductase [Rhodococcus zopfii]|uniref:TIGR03621 family F420-dependent LLM class oxidoreductase n=1 Tax=Rhodococcus zopfii TaxID=43772 RepID=A0ABU3WP74_9NOCA|nr:TIGR03621 family F420-dependent LLM class oxidoreductase [Rhodococcus zopfii]MDV2475795.1 TIGR03621 family F420-dependent LLM class oxidoreductase [Rhodococcus zopfii]
MTDFRFSVNVLGIESPEGFARSCRAVEDAGFDALFAADHLGVPAPFPVLVAAAHATERMRVGTLVLNAAFWNPALLAREIATTDALTGGRLEVGLGAGHMRWEFESAGIAWESFGTRADHLESTVTALRRLFAQPAYEPQAAMREAFGLPVLRPVQRHGFGGEGPPLIIGGTGDRILAIAGACADIVSVAGAYQVPGRPPGTFRIGSAAEADERIRFTRACAGPRADHIEWHTLVQMVIETDDRRAAAAAAAERLGIRVGDLLDTPFVLIGTVEEMAAQILTARDRYGFTHFTVHAPYRDVFARVIAQVRANGVSPAPAD